MSKCNVVKLDMDKIRKHIPERLDPLKIAVFVEQIKEDTRKYIESMPEEQRQKLYKLLKENEEA